MLGQVHQDGHFVSMATHCKIVMETPHKQALSLQKLTIPDDVADVVSRQLYWEANKISLSSENIIKTVS